MAVIGEIRRPRSRRIRPRYRRKTNKLLKCRIRFSLLVVSSQGGPTQPDLGWIRQNQCDVGQTWRHSAEFGLFWMILANIALRSTKSERSLPSISSTFGPNRQKLAGAPAAANSGPNSTTERCPRFRVAYGVPWSGFGDHVYQSGALRRQESETRSPGLDEPPFLTATPRFRDNMQYKTQAWKRNQPMLTTCLGLAENCLKSLQKCGRPGRRILRCEPELTTTSRNIGQIRAK